MYVSYLFGSRYVFVILLFRTLLMSSFCSLSLALLISAVR